MSTQTRTLNLGLADEGREVSSEEFAAASFEEPWKYEREGGRLIVLAPSGEDPSDLTEHSRDVLGVYKVAHPEVVQRVACEAWIRFDGGIDRMADIGVYLRTDGPRVPRPDRVPDLVFEVVSQGKASIDRDYVRKRAEHQRSGVKEYVIVDRFRRVVTVLSASPQGLTGRTLDPNDSYESPLLPGLVIPLRDIF